MEPTFTPNAEHFAKGQLMCRPSIFPALAQTPLARLATPGTKVGRGIIAGSIPRVAPHSTIFQ
jgi:hypothetical protein